MMPMGVRFMDVGRVGRIWNQELVQQGIDSYFMANAKRDISYFVLHYDCSTRLA